MKTSISINRP